MAKWVQTSARGHQRKGNNPYKAMLQSLRFPNTETQYLKDWLLKKCTGVHVEQGQTLVLYEGKAINCKSIAEAVWTLYVKYGVK